MNKIWTFALLLKWLGLSIIIGSSVALYQLIAWIKYSPSYFEKPIDLIVQDIQNYMNKWVFIALMVSFFCFVFILLLKRAFGKLITKNGVLKVKILNRDKFVATIAASCLIGTLGYFGVNSLPFIKIYLYRIAFFRNLYNQFAPNASENIYAAIIIVIFVFLSLIASILPLLTSLLSKVNFNRILMPINKLKTSKITNLVLLREVFPYKALISMILLLLIIVNISPIVVRYYSEHNLDKNSPNVILVTIDTLRHDHVGCYGYGRDTTPNIDKFANESVIFKTAIAPTPLTYPSHTSILSGLYPKNHRVINNRPIKISSCIDLLPLQLRKRGYTTAAFLSGYTLHSNMTDLKKYFDFYDDKFKGWERQAAMTTKCALSWLKRNHHRYFFLWIHYFDPHGNYTPPIEYMQGFSNIDNKNGYIRFHDLSSEKRLQVAESHAKKQQLIDQYDGEIAYVDHCFGQIIEQLKELNLYKDSIIIVTSDHGESLTEHKYLFDHSEYLYDPSLKIPLIVKGAGEGNPSVIEKQVGLIDIMPTVFELLGIEYEKEKLDGKSLVQLMEGEEIGWNNVYYAKIFTGEIPGDKTLVASITQNEKVIITKPWWSGKVLIECKEELYDLQRDPSESEDLSHIYKSRLEELKKKIDRWETEKIKIDGEPQKGVMTKNMQEKLRSLGYIN